MNIIEELKSKEVKPKVLALKEHKSIDQALETVEKKFNKFGINNVTKKHLEKGIDKVKSDKNKDRKLVAENELEKALINTFGMYKVISYKNLNDVAKDHNLHISGLNIYNKAIPEENIEELDNFTEYLKTINPDNISIATNNNYSFSNINKTFLRNVSFDKMFFIVAPKSHLNITKFHTQIGREFSDNINKPSFTFNFKLNKPEPIDPIIFMVVKAFNKAYCVMVTAWDKVADDTRIRQMV